MEERELEGIKRESEALAEHLEGLADEVDTEVVAAIIRELISGHTASAIIEEYALYAEGV